MARPSKYTPKIIETICESLAEGIPLAQLCRQEGMPAYRTVWDWMQTMPEVSKAIACAREEGEEVIAANTRQIARGISPESTKDVQRDKLIIENDLKLLAKWNPKKWGDRLQTENRNVDKDGNDIIPKSDNELNTRLAELLNKK